MTYYEKVQSMPDEWIEREIERIVELPANLQGHSIVCLRQEKKDRIMAGYWMENKI